MSELLFSVVTDREMHAFECPSCVSQPCGAYWWHFSNSFVSVCSNFYLLLHLDFESKLEEFLSTWVLEEVACFRILGKFDS